LRPEPAEKQLKSAFISPPRWETSETAVALSLQKTFIADALLSLQKTFVADALLSLQKTLLREVKKIS